ncbi:hypothetical protein Scep_028396 [Stephania cephalantha]|uniref:Uncharacterized protein n=1 Tax=Stephania cephalantha TaxID=152367 RepID=A0AAP0E9V7_9MAGN
MVDEKELCNTQPTSYSEENVDVDTLSNVEENVDTPVENYWCATTQGLEVLQIEPDKSIAPNDDDDAALEIGVISERPEEPQIESKEDQPLVLVKPPTLPCIFVKPYTGWNDVASSDWTRAAVMTLVKQTPPRVACTLVGQRPFAALQRHASAADASGRIGM